MDTVKSVISETAYVFLFLSLAIFGFRFIFYICRKIIEDGVFQERPPKDGQLQLKDLYKEVK